MSSLTTPISQIKVGDKVIIAGPHSNNIDHVPDMFKKVWTVQKKFDPDQDNDELSRIILQANSDLATYIHTSKPNPCGGTKHCISMPEVNSDITDAIFHFYPEGEPQVCVLTKNQAKKNLQIQKAIKQLMKQKLYHEEEILVNQDEDMDWFINKPLYSTSNRDHGICGCPHLRVSFPGIPDAYASDEKKEKKGSFN